MKYVSVNQIIDEVEKMCIEANCKISKDIDNALKGALQVEESPQGCSVIKEIIKNNSIAAENNIPICQDTGMVVVFVEIGQDVHVKGGLISDAINEGVRRGYINGYLRKSVVSDPFERKNTNDNTPAVIHYEIVPGDKIKLTLGPKGFGSENMSAIKMLKPSDGLQGVKNFIINTVSNAGANPCPPIVVGVGVGGTMEKAAILAKKATLRPLNKENKNEKLKSLEQELLIEINKLGIGPAGFGGRSTAMGVNIETYPTHIAGLPVAVNISCHVTRHVSNILEGSEA